MRFLHLADLHLDTAFAGRTRELRVRLRDATAQALETAVSTALDERVDAVLIAGDLLDGAHFSFATERVLLGELGRLDAAGIAVVYVTGNHDPGERGGAVLRVPWPENVQLISGPDPVRVEIARGGRPVGVVMGAGHPSGHHGEDLSRAFPRPEGSLPHVGLLHTQVGGAAGSEEHHRYAPSELARLERAGYHYWALGHVHLRQELCSAPGIHYPGNLQGRSPRETGPKGGLLVDLSAPDLPRVDFVELAPLRWESLRVGELEGVERVEDVVRRIEAEWRRVREADPGKAATQWLARVELTGATALSAILAREEELEGVAEALSAGLGLLDVEVRTEGLRPRREVAAHAERQDVLGEALRLLLALTRDEALSPEEELELEAEELAGYDPSEHGALDRYVRSLLDGEAPAMVDALMEEGR